MITIHGVFGSPFVRALRIALHEKALPWAWAPFAIGEQKQEPHLSRQPFGKMPAIEDDGFPLYETQAILRYIDRKQPDPALIPADLHAAARMDQMLAILDCALWPDVSRPICFNRIVAPLIGAPVNEAAVASAVPPAHIALGAIAALAGDGPFLTGETPSLADCALLPHLDWLAITKEGRPIVEAHEKLAAWLTCMRARPSVMDSLRPPQEVLAKAAA